VEPGGVGVWSVALCYSAMDEVVDAAELESLGYSALWFREAEAKDPRT
jgi:hypothetical protein